MNFSPFKTNEMNRFFHTRPVGMLAAALLALLSWAACTKSTPFGADLLDDQVADYIYTDTITVQFSTVLEDSIRTDDKTSTADYLLCGQIKDPIFGVAKSEIFTLMQPINLGRPARDSGVVPIFDSLVLYLAIDPKGLYGDTLQPQTFKVSRINPDSKIERSSKKYYSSDKMPADVEVGSATLNIRPSRKDSLVFGRGASKSVTGTGSFLRIPLSADFGKELLGLDAMGFDSTIYTSDTLFWAKLRGLKIECTTPDGRLMSAFDMNNTGLSRMTLFYTKKPTDTISTRYHFQFTSGNKFTHFTHDYAGSEVESHLGKPNDNLLFLQGMTGTRVKVDIPFANNFDNIAVNEMYLELTAAELSGDNLAWYPVPDQLVMTDTSKGLTPDVLYAVGSSLNQGFARFGGFPREETVNDIKLKRYRMMLGQRFQDMVDQKPNDLKGTTVYVNVYPQITSAKRMVFYGQGSTNYPAKLIMKYTRL